MPDDLVQQILIGAKGSIGSRIIDQIFHTCSKISSSFLILFSQLTVTQKGQIWDHFFLLISDQSDILNSWLSFFLAVHRSSIKE